MRARTRGPKGVSLPIVWGFVEWRALRSSYEIQLKFAGRSTLPARQYSKMETALLICSVAFLATGAVGAQANPLDSQRVGPRRHGRRQVSRRPPGSGQAGTGGSWRVRTGKGESGHHECPGGTGGETAAIPPQPVIPERTPGDLVNPTQGKRNRFGSAYLQRPRGSNSQGQEAAPASQSCRPV